MNLELPEESNDPTVFLHRKDENDDEEDDDDITLFDKTFD